MGHLNSKKVSKTCSLLSKTKLRFEVIFHPLNMKSPDLVYEDKAVKVSSFPLKHSIPCCGFYFEEKAKPRKFIKESLEKYSIPVADIRQIKMGADWEDEDGNIIPNTELTTDGPASRSYAYCTDTAPLEKLPTLLPGKPDLLYHEATFTDQHKKRAKQTRHSTAMQAGQVAQNVQAKHLLIGHFSVRYDDFSPLLEEAKSSFANTYLALQNSTFTLKTPQKLLIERTA